jgi:hypothetical protein
MVGGRLAGATRIGIVTAVVVLASAIANTTPAFAEQAWWKITSGLAPTKLPSGPGHSATLAVTVVNAGDAAVNPDKCIKVAPGTGKFKDAACTEAAAPGEEEFEKNVVKVTDVLPAGLEVTGVTLPEDVAPVDVDPLETSIHCDTEHLPSTSLTCEWTGEYFDELTEEEIHEPLQPYERIELLLTVVTAAVPDDVPGEVVVTGGEDYECQRVSPREGHFKGAFCRERDMGPRGSGEFEGVFTEKFVSRASLEQPVPAVGDTLTPFGVESFEMTAEDEGGAVDSQAGSHPFQLTTTLALNQTANANVPPASLKDVSVKLPAGFAGDVNAVAQCTDAEFAEAINNSVANGCPPQTAIGVAIARINPGEEFGKAITREVPIFNLVPAQGEPARFGFESEHVPITIDTSVRTGEDYGVTAAVHNISQVANIFSSTLIFWGVPGDPRHNLARGWSCVQGGTIGFSLGLPECGATSDGGQSPYLTLPTSCTGPMETSVEGDSWGNGSQKLSMPLERVTSFVEGLDGCNRLVAFTPSISVAPDEHSASTPTGLSVKVRVPQEADLNPSGLADAEPRDITVTLPAGVITNPAGAGGLESCSETQIGYSFRVSGPPREEQQFSSGLPEPFCPDAAKVGTVKITTPDLPNPLEGAVYLAAQDANPFGSLVALYIVAEDPTAGVLAKIPVEIELNGATGQLTTKVRNSPEVPFEEAEFNFFGGERAPLATPSHCGTYTTTASFVPWSGNAAVNSSSSFAIGSGPHGGACPGSTLPFSASLTAGTTSLQAGAFSTLTSTVSREDGNQSIQTVQVHLPTGLAGILTGVKLCEEAPANAGTCGPESQIGETTVSAGLGGEPYTVTGGKVYLTGPYEGAPFGLSIASPAKAGPFDLGKGACDCVVVRAKIEVNPLTGALTATTNSSGPFAIPQILDGIPLEIKHVNITSNRPGFVFDPTNCSPLTITGNIAGNEGGSSTPSAPFEVANCATLGFAPKAAVSSKGKASKANGASLLFKITYPKNAMGSQSWLNEVKVDIPKQLPVRLSTIQKACLASVFESDRPACPPQSIIGHVVVHTPVVPVPLEGPIYFVSYGNKKFPEAVFVLKGYGITIEQHGETFIDHKTGITSATFSNIPDLPVESIEASLPTGPFSEFTANLPAKDHYNLCGHKLVMPALFKGSNGAVIHTSLTASITGCPKKAKKPKKAEKPKKSKKA